MHQYDAFVSYSRADEALVKPIAQILGIGKRKVFWDAHIEPGERWMPRISDALANAKLVIVLWCCHSAESRFVETEIDHALAYEKPIVPVLICPYPAREPLDEIQGIDFRELTRHSCVGGHPTGRAFGQEDAGEFVLTQFAPQTDNAETALSDWMQSTRSSSRLPGLAAVSAGIAMTVLGPHLPFVVAGALIAAAGAVSMGRTQVRADAPSLLLAAVIETLIRQAERGETRGRLARAR